MARTAQKRIDTDAPVLAHAKPRLVAKAVPVEAAPEKIRRGRGALSNPSGRFEAEQREQVDDGWGSLEDVLEDLPVFATTITRERPKSIITRNESPDISFDRSINPYRGCEHGCTYCFARPTHAYVGLSAGLDFETRLFVKDGAADLLERELSAKNYQPKTIAIGTNTDPYQPIERTHRIMRSLLDVLARHNHPVGIVTKSALVTRDIDLLGPDGGKGTGEGRAVDHDARPQAGAVHGAARLDARATPRGDPAIVGGWHSDDRHGRTDHPGGERCRDRDHPHPRA